MGKRIMITGAHLTDLWKRYARDAEVDKLILVCSLWEPFREEVMQEPAYIKEGKIVLFIYETTDPEFTRLVTEHILAWRDLSPPEARLDKIYHQTLLGSYTDPVVELDMAYLGTRNVLEIAKLYRSRVFIGQNESYKEAFGIADALAEAYRKKYGLEIMDL